MYAQKVSVSFDEKRIDELLAGLNQCHIPGAAVGIMLHGRPVYRKGFGLSNMELPVVLSTQTRMRIGSTTKHFVCLAYLLLCEEGRAGIDNPLGKHLPELHPTTHKVTVRQLMGNIGGLRDVHDITWQFAGHGSPLSSDSLWSLYRDITDANAKPGTAWIYSNGGFLLLSAVVERITGLSLEEVLSEYIFERAGMYDTLLRRHDVNFVPHSAALHVPSETGGYKKTQISVISSGEGAVVSTVDDLLRWLAHMDDPRVGNEATWAAMKTPGILANGMSTRYGFGLFLGRYRGIETLSHAGGVLGGNAQMMKIPAAGLDVVVIVNRQDVLGMSLVNQILDSCLTGLDPVEEPFRGPFAAGVFRSPATGRVIRLFAKDEQQFASIDGGDFPVAKGRDGLLRPPGVYDTYKYEIALIGSSKEPIGVRLADFGNFDEFARVESVDVADVRALLGHYRSDTTGVEATISEAGSGLRVTTACRFGTAIRELDCLADGIWQLKAPDLTAPPGGVLSFDNSTTFRFSSLCNRSLDFRRCS